MAIMQECPYCHKRQSLRNKRCKCGADLDREKKNKKIRYHIINRIEGKQVQRSVASFEGCSPYSLEDARDIEAKFRTAKREGKLDIFRPKRETLTTFKELSDWYLNLESVKALASIGAIRTYINKFNSEFGNMAIGQIKLVNLENLQAKRKKQGLKPKTIDDEIKYTKSMVIKAFDNDLITGEPLKALRRVKSLLKGNTNARDRILTVSEYSSLFEHSQKPLEGIISLGYWSGMRKGEIVNLTWDKVDLKHRMITLEAEDTKESKKKSIPISEETFQILKKIPRSIHDDHVFSIQYRDINYFRKAMMKACKDAGIQWGSRVKGGFIFHDLRHTFVTDARKAGVSKSVRMSITGHSSRDMDSRYDRIDDQDKIQAIKILETFRKNVSKTVSNEGNGKH